MDIKFCPKNKRIWKNNRYAIYKNKMQNVQNYNNTNTVNTAYTVLWIILIHKISSM
jgi:hypothetical protein